MIDRDKADDYNAKQEVSSEVLTELALIAQDRLGLEVDGMLGPRTRSVLSALRHVPITKQSPLLIDSNQHWMGGDGLTVMAAHPSWYGGKIEPKAVIWHYTNTDPGTSIAMGKRRTRQRGLSPDDRAASWHFTIDTDGSIIQHVPLTRLAWHAGGKSKKPIPGIGWPNDHSIGIELVSQGGEHFPEAQVLAAARVALTISEAFKIPEKLHLGHRDVHEWKNDPGDLWSRKHHPRIMEYVYGW